MEATNIEKYFERQETGVLTEKMLSELKGESIYGPYEVGDVVYFFMEEIQTEPERYEIHIKTVTKKDLKRFDEEYVYVRNTGSIMPLFGKRK